MRATFIACWLPLVLSATSFVSGCATPDWARDWALVECFPQSGVRISLDHMSYWYVSGSRYDPHVYRNGTRPPWRFPEPEDREGAPIDPGGGELSQRGQLAVAWRYRRVEVFDFKTGASLTRIPCRAIAVGWSNDGTRLAYLAQPDGGSVETQDFDVHIWSPDEGQLASWRVRFGSIGPPPWHWGVNAFTINWDAQDQYFAVSTRSLPLGPRPWQTVVFEVERGPVCEYPYADAFFVGPGLLVACDKTKTIWGRRTRELLLLRVQGDALVREKTLIGRMPVAASRPEEGIYLIWEEPPWWELWVPKGLTLGLRKIDSGQEVRDRFFGEANSLTLIRSDLVPPLPNGPATRPAGR